MAHSSGGGSSGGGFHGGSSGSSGSNHVYYRHPTPGTRRYAYVDKTGQKRYFYSKAHPAEYKLTSLIMPFFVLLILVLGTPSLEIGFFIPEKLNTPGEEILIDDRLHAFTEESRLKAAMIRFYEETGVVPAVQTITQEEWSGSFSSLESYAYREYGKLFKDEYHWLIVYSVPQNERGRPDFSSWSFEGMIGDDTGPSVNDALCYRFTRDTYQSLEANHGPEEALCRAWGNLLRDRKPGFYSEETLGAPAFFLTLFRWGILLLWPGMEFYTCYEAKIKYRNAVLDE